MARRTTMRPNALVRQVLARPVAKARQALEARANAVAPPAIMAAAREKS